LPHAHQPRGPGAAGEFPPHVPSTRRFSRPDTLGRRCLPGFTTIRDPRRGANSSISRCATPINRGVTSRDPRIQAATMPISANRRPRRSQAATRRMSAPASGVGVADGVDEIRKKNPVRSEVRGRRGSRSPPPRGANVGRGVGRGLPSTPRPRLDAVVDEAKIWGRPKFAAHAHGAEGIKRAVRAGVASIDHGTFLDEEGARLMVEHGTYSGQGFLRGPAGFLERAPGWGYPKIIIEKLGKNREGARGRLPPRGGKPGVKIAFGTDAGMLPPRRETRSNFATTSPGG